jgi:hypothetical protein
MKYTFADSEAMMTIEAKSVRQALAYFRDWYCIKGKLNKVATNGNTTTYYLVGSANYKFDLTISY